MEAFIRRLSIELGIIPSDDKPGPLAILIATIVGLAVMLAIVWWVTG